MISERDRSSDDRGWSVWREDDNGNRFRMHDGLTRDEARRIAEDFTRRGHKQRYWCQQEDP